MDFSSYDGRAFLKSAQNQMVYVAPNYRVSIDDWTTYSSVFAKFSVCSWELLVFLQVQLYKEKE